MLKSYDKFENMSLDRKMKFLYLKLDYLHYSVLSLLLVSISMILNNSIFLLIAIVTFAYGIWQTGRKKKRQDEPEEQEADIEDNTEEISEQQESQQSQFDESPERDIKAEEEMPYV